jgi:tRNA pseudouridine55 synthase
MGRRTVDSGLDGLLIIDKPAGMGSTDVVNIARRAKKQKRSGHSGTLDPSATGVILVAFGQCTKLLQYLGGFPKSYEGDLVLGATTDSLDADGVVLSTHDMSNVTLADVQAAAAQQVGDILQIPPMVSAIKMGGQRLHELHRQGIEVERKPRPVSVYRYDVKPTDDPLVYRVSVECSSGTYVRVLVADVGETLGGGAHLRNLRRTAIGPFGLDRAVPLDDQIGDAELLTGPQMLGHLPEAQVDESTVKQIMLGQVKPRTDFPSVPADATAWRVQHGDRLLAIYEPFRDGDSKPSVVLNRDN